MSLMKKILPFFAASFLSLVIFRFFIDWGPFSDLAIFVGFLAFIKNHKCQQEIIKVVRK